MKKYTWPQLIPHIVFSLRSHRNRQTSVTRIHDAQIGQFYDEFYWFMNRQLTSIFRSACRQTFGRCTHVRLSQSLEDTQDTWTSTKKNCSYASQLRKATDVSAYLELHKHRSYPDFIFSYIPVNIYVFTDPEIFKVRVITSILVVQASSLKVCRSCSMNKLISVLVDK